MTVNLRNEDIKNMAHTCEVQTLLKITNVAVWMNHPMIISRLVRMKKRPELNDRISWVRKLVKGDRMNALHIDDRATADVEILG
jgi:hypothetical protein